MLPKTAPTQQFLAELEKVKKAFSDIASWADTHVVADDCFPRELPTELENILHVAFSSCEALESRIRSFKEEKTKFMYQIFVKLQRDEALSEYEFYFCRALGDLKSASASENEFQSYLENRSRRSGDP